MVVLVLLWLSCVGVDVAVDVVVGVLGVADAVAVVVVASGRPLVCPSGCACVCLWLCVSVCRGVCVCCRRVWLIVRCVCGCVFV